MVTQREKTNYLIHFPSRHWKSNLNCPWFISYLFIKLFMCLGIVPWVFCWSQSLCDSCLDNDSGWLYMLTTQVLYLFNTNHCCCCCQHHKCITPSESLFSCQTNQACRVYNSQCKVFFSDSAISWISIMLCSRRSWLYVIVMDCTMSLIM